MLQNTCLALAAVIISLGLFARITGSPVSSECQNLTPEEEEKMLEEHDINSDFHDNFLPQILSGGSEGQQTSLSDLLQQSQMNYPTTCPSPGDVPSSPSTPVYARSSCPWYLRLENVPNRHPKIIPVAVPRCNATQSCVGISADQKSNFECERVYVTMKVLRKVKCSETLSKWVEGTERVAVGTTCVRTKQQESSSSVNQGPPTI
ncbi:interleukin 17-like protein [Ylistrum balloti]|uniref:interleukin 17-like protein n=1 Tax=Ylistrum balloti TaxID=509963 RepID=UPI002905C333|nr:interleukin 17-like protein [Ylistrum balloti]